MVVKTKTPGLRKAPDTNHGKLFEKFVSAIFDSLRLRYPFHWERIMDSHEAGNIVRKADCDYKLVISGKSVGQPFLFWIEMKASRIHSTLATCFRNSAFLKPDQVAKMRIGHRAGVMPIYMFLDVETGDIEIWNGITINEAREHRRQKFTGRPAYVINKNNAERFFKGLVVGPELFLAHVLRS